MKWDNIFYYDKKKGKGIDIDMIKDGNKIRIIVEELIDKDIGE